ncbi:MULTISPECIES: hypothetical protein [Pantoea]|jgi:hypothetical protein|uniref:hypothetical protein n=1 Tax=Pantoea TaxID=53335 RepID=UPI0013DDBC1D|nr:MULTISPECIES: hypothetical protein [Pantoea]MCK0554679.1 hypothetical protein [Pantoea ananatis]MCS4496234.1 hypothetical protein [Pantoea sp. B623]MDI3415671.1 hypothetical protein [Pantoea sp. V106_11]QIE96896.1 hypothetical protein G5574_07965 [Pantoea stewartii]WRH12408.1 hypothetical protein GC087_07130 [Pantoea sp. JZ2]
MEPFDFKEFWQGLSTEEKKQLAKEAGTTTHYIRTHLVYARRVPTRNYMTGLQKACAKIDPAITTERLLSFFYSAA